MLRTGLGPCLVALALASSSCTKDRPRSQEATPTASAAAKAILEGDVVATGAARGRLVVGWRTAAEQAELEHGNFTLKMARDMVERYEVGEETDFAKTPRVRYRVTDAHAPPDAVAVAVLDVDHMFWPTAFGNGPGLVGNSKPGGGEIAIAALPSRASADEPCAGPRRKLIAIAAQGLSTLPRPVPGGGPGQRRFCAWLPKSFTANGARRYPIVLLLPGLMSTEMAYLSGGNHLGTRFDAIAEKTGREAVLVGVDTSTASGSTYLENSPMGAYDTFLRDVALPRIEAELHGIGSRTARALIGQSTGGYNALSYGLRHPDLFSAIGSSSPDAPDFERWMLEPDAGPRSARAWFRRLTRLEDELGGPGQLMSYAIDWSPPAPGARPTWPIDPKTGAVDDAVLARWVAKTPHGLLRDPSFAARARTGLSGRVLVIVGRNDEFGLFDPAEQFAKELDSKGIATTFTPTDHGHGNGVDRLEVALGFVIEKLDRAR